MKTPFIYITFLFSLSLFGQQIDSTHFIAKWEKEYSKQPEFSGFTLYKNINPFYLTGDFFGDENLDIVFFIEGENNKVKLAFINHGIETQIHILGTENDPFNIDDYKWAGIFKKINNNDVLWSNYIDDFRPLKDVPESEKVYLNYNAIYLHALESCGGGFIYWKDGKFNWLQQE